MAVDWRGERGALINSFAGLRQSKGREILGAGFAADEAEFYAMVQASRYFQRATVAFKEKKARKAMDFVERGVLRACQPRYGAQNVSIMPTVAEMYRISVGENRVLVCLVTYATT